MLKSLKNENNKGVVLVTVLMIIIVVTIITVSVISMNVTQVTSTEKVIKQLQAETLAQGAWAYTYAYKTTVNQNATTIPLPEAPTFDGVPFAWTSTPTTYTDSMSNVTIGITY